MNKKMRDLVIESISEVCADGESNESFFDAVSDQIRSRLDEELSDRNMNEDMDDDQYSDAASEMDDMYEEACSGIQDAIGAAMIAYSERLSRREAVAKNKRKKAAKNKSKRK